MSTNLNSSVCRTVEAAQTEETKWTAKMVEEYFLEVISTLKKLPSVKLQGYCTLWPDIIYSPNEIMFQEKMPIRLLASPVAISRLEKTFEWMIWLSIEERKLIWKRAAKAKWKLICWELGCDLSTAQRRWNKALSKIAYRLNNEQIISKNNCKSSISLLYRGNHR